MNNEIFSDHLLHELYNFILKLSHKDNPFAHNPSLSYQDVLDLDTRDIQKGFPCENNKYLYKKHLWKLIRVIIYLKLSINYEIVYG